MAEQTVVQLGSTSANDIALELWKQIRQTHGAKDSVDAELELFQQCRTAVLTRK